MDRLKRAKIKQKENNVISNANRIKSPDGKRCNTREKRVEERNLRKSYEHSRLN